MPQANSNARTARIDGGLREETRFAEEPIAYAFVHKSSDQTIAETCRQLGVAE